MRSQLIQLRKKNEIFFWSDGSAKCNPDILAIAWHGEGAKDNKKYPFINHICNAELEAIQAILKHIINSTNKYNKASVIKIFTDPLISIILIVK